MQDVAATATSGSELGKTHMASGNHSRAFSTLFALTALLLPLHAQHTQPTLDDILQRLESNLQHYDKDVPSLFCDEHAVSQMTPGQRNQNTVTDSVFRLKRVLNPDHSTTLDESREVKTVNGRARTARDIDGPTVISGAFEGGLAVISLSQRACMNYSLQRAKHPDPTASYVINFSTDLTRENTASCLLQEKSHGRALIDPATMQITHMEITTPHHIIIRGSAYASPVKGERLLTVDYAPVQLDGRTFWMPATIDSRTTSGAGTFHAIVWSFHARYRNFHKLEVTSRILPSNETPSPQP
jgi:hypothetical protein